MKQQFPLVASFGSLLLYVASNNLYASCGQGATATITNLPTLGGVSYEADALNAKGQITGYSDLSGDMTADIFLYGSSGLTDLGNLNGSFSQGLALNELGQVAGQADLPDGTTHAVLSAGGPLIDLGTLGGNFSSASSLNDAGQVVGTSRLSQNADQHAFLYQNRAMNDLGSLGGTFSTAYVINQSGTVAGDSYTTNNAAYHSFLYSNGTMTDIGTLGGDYTSTFTMNDSNIVVGESSIASGDVHGFIYSGGVMHDMGTLGGDSSSAHVVNSVGQAAGISTTTSNAQTHAFFYSDGAITDLGTLGGTFSQANAINSLGQVVGHSSLPDSTVHAFLWQKGTMVDLNNLVPTNSGWQLNDANFINDSGRIVGSGMLNGNFQFFILDLAGTDSPPVAVAGPDQVVDCQSAVTLDGTGSSDPDGDSLAFVWTEATTVLGTNSVVSISLPIGTNIITLTVSDPCGLSAKTNVTVLVVDTHPPVILNAPDSITAIADANCQAPVPNLISNLVATDDCTAPSGLVFDQNPAPGTQLMVGHYGILLTVADPSGNVASTNISFTVVDKTAPVIVSAPASLTASADANCQAPAPNVLSSIVAVDNCTPANLLTFSQSPVAGAPLNDGQHTIVVTVADAAGNTASTNISFTVLDKTAPVIVSAPASLTASADASGQAPVPNVTSQIVATDNCTPSDQLTIAQSPLTGTELPVGQYTIVVTATDLAGNSTTQDVQLTISSSTGGPVIQSVTASPSVLSPPNHQLIPVVVTVVVSDASDPHPVSKIISITANEPLAPGEVQITGNLTAKLAASRNGGGGGRIYTITIKSCDKFGNSATAVALVVVPQGNGNGVTAANHRSSRNKR